MFSHAAHFHCPSLCAGVAAMFTALPPTPKLIGPEIVKEAPEFGTGATEPKLKEPSEETGVALPNDRAAGGLADPNEPKVKEAPEVGFGATAPKVKEP